jgi:N,N'-diacetyllegionaminate synthase
VTTLVIAEAGVNHNGELRLALDLVDAAAAAGADVVKFQTFAADRLATASVSKAPYQERDRAGESQYEMLRRLELSREAHLRILERCRARGIEFLSTAFDLESIDLLAELGLRRAKIPSGEITDLPYLRRIASLGLPILLSTGMAEMEDIRAALDALEQAGAARGAITLLHCTTEYPAAMAGVNLHAMETLGRTFGVPVGYSDHTEGIEVAVAAVALGATVIEKHFTLDRGMPGPDHRASLEPAALRQMVAAIRNIEQALGDGVKRPTEAERSTATIVRKSIVAAVAIEAGEPFTAANVTAKRAGRGLSPMQWDEVLGRRAPRRFAPDECIEL